MRNSRTILDNVTVPSGIFGAFQPEGNPPGSVSFTNNSPARERISVLGSNDGKNWTCIQKLSAASGKTDMRKVKVPLFMQFRNRGAAFGPATLILVNAD